MVVFHLNRIFHYKPSSYWGTHILGNLHIYSELWMSMRFNEMCVRQVGENFWEVAAMLRPGGVYHVYVFSN